MQVSSNSHRSLLVRIFLAMALWSSVPASSQQAQVQVRVQLAPTLRYMIGDGRPGAKVQRWEAVSRMAAEDLARHLDQEVLAELAPWAFVSTESDSDLVLEIEQDPGGYYSLSVSLELRKRYLFRNKRLEGWEWIAGAPWCRPGDLRAQCRQDFARLRAPDASTSKEVVVKLFKNLLDGKVKKDMARRLGSYVPIATIEKWDWPVALTPLTFRDWVFLKEGGRTPFAWCTEGDEKVTELIGEWEGRSRTLVRETPGVMKAWLEVLSFEVVGWRRGNLLAYEKIGKQSFCQSPNQRVEVLLEPRWYRVSSAMGGQ